jgi:hypothetical protein
MVFKTDIVCRVNGVDILISPVPGYLVPMQPIARAILGDGNVEDVVKKMINDKTLSEALNTAKFLTPDGEDTYFSLTLWYCLGWVFSLFILEPHDPDEVLRNSRVLKIYDSLTNYFVSDCEKIRKSRNILLKRVRNMEILRSISKKGAVCEDRISRLDNDYKDLTGKFPSDAYDYIEDDDDEGD